MKSEMKRRRSRAWLLVVPFYFYTIVFVILPLAYMVLLSFLQRAEIWGVTKEVTWDNYKNILEPIYLHTFAESLKLALICTALIALLGYPFGYFMAKLSKKWKSRVMILLMIPFWTSALIRMYGWIIIFRSNGLLDRLFMAIHLT